MNETQELVLKPCPACGSDNLAHVNPPDAPTSYYHVWCKACMLAGPQSDPSAAKWQALPRTSGDGARLRKLREWIWNRREAPDGHPWAMVVPIVTEIDRMLAEPEPQPVPAVAPVSVPSHVREWCRWAADHYGPTDPEGANEGAVARWVLSLSLPTAPPAGRSAAPEGELEKLRAEVDYLRDRVQRDADEIERLKPGRMPEDDPHWPEASKHLRPEHNTKTLVHIIAMMGAENEALRKELHEATGVAQAMEQRYEDKRAEVEALRKERDEARQGVELCCEEPETCTDKCAWREAHALRTTCRTLACELAAAVGKAVDNG
jgi:hypothetical protein